MNIDELAIGTIQEPDITEKSNGEIPGATPFTIPGLTSFEGTAKLAGLTEKAVSALDVIRARITLPVIITRIALGTEQNTVRFMLSNGTTIERARVATDLLQDDDVRIEFKSTRAPTLELLEDIDKPKPKGTA